MPERLAITRRRWMILPFETRAPIAARSASHCSAFASSIAMRAERLREYLDRLDVYSRFVEQVLGDPTFTTGTLNLVIVRVAGDNVNRSVS